MKTRKPNSEHYANVVLKNAKFWNGKSFELRDEVCLTGSTSNEDSLEYDCNGALVLPALFALGVDFMEPL